MAHKVTNPKIGMYVYMPYSANKPGKIKRVLDIEEAEAYQAGMNLPSQVKADIMKNPFQFVEVVWINNTITIERVGHLSDFEALIADHKKKLNTHTSKLKNLEKL